MNTNLFIHYENQENSNELELKTLCHSLLGFESLLRELLKISRLQADIEIKAKASKNGSYIEWIILGFDFLSIIPFEKLPDFLDFVQIIDPVLHKEAEIFFNTHGFDLVTVKKFFTDVLNGQTKAQIFVNDFVKERPAEYDFMKWLFGALSIRYLIGVYCRLTKVKNQVMPDENTSTKTFKSLKKIIKKGSAKKAMNPFVENEIEKIGFSQNGKRIENKTIVDRKNFGNLLPDSEQILPGYANGSFHEFKGGVKNFHSARGDFMKIEVFLGEHGNHILIVKPDEQHETKDFRSFYKENVIFRAEVLRESFYEKPKLKIIGTMELAQEEFFPEK